MRFKLAAFALKRTLSPWNKTLFGYRSFFGFGFFTASRSASYWWNHCWNRLRVTPRHDLLASWYIVLSRTGKSDFNDLKCLMWAIRNWGVFLSRSGPVSRTKGLVSISGCFDLRGLRRTDRIWNNSRVANYRFPEFQLPGFHNVFQFNCQIGLWLLFGLDMLHYPLQHRPRFWLNFFMCFHMRLQCACVPATLVASRIFQRFVRHLCSRKTTAIKTLNKTFNREM